MEKLKVPQGVLVTGMLCLTAVELWALTLGHNGMFLSLFVALIAGAMGLSLPQLKVK